MWTVQRTEKYFSKDPLFQDAPKIERAACKPGQAPVCTGYVYCPVPGVRMFAFSAACKSIKVNDKWRCPDAETCVNDQDIAISEIGKIPGAVKAAAPATPAETTN
jgi:hypothetical protein